MTSLEILLSVLMCVTNAFLKELIYCNLGLIHIEFKAQGCSVKS